MWAVRCGCRAGCRGSSWRRWWRGRRGCRPRGSRAAEFIVSTNSSINYRNCKKGASATHPALVTNALRTLATDADTNDVGGGVEELLGHADELVVADGLGEGINGHGGDELVVLDGGAVLEGDCVCLGVDLLDGTVLAEAAVLLVKGLGHSDPDTTGTVAGWEAESRVGTPVAGRLLENDVLCDILQVGRRDTLAEPRTLHLWRKSAGVRDGLAMMLRN